MRSSDPMLPDHSPVPACPACLCEQRHPWHRKNGYDVVECERCGFRYVSELPSDEFLRAHYRSSYCQSDGTFQPKGGLLRRLKYRAFAVWFKRAILRHRESAADAVRILELGCGQGDLLKAFSGDASVRVTGMDYAAGPIGHLRERGFDAHLGGLDEAPVGPESLDGIVMLHVLEHVRDPGAVIAHAARLLKRGGLLYVVCPCSGHIKARIAGDRWKYLGPPDHLWYFTPRSMRTMAARMGFDVLRSSNLYHRAHVTLVAKKL
ncbi:MAG: methyltransferase domain-containing protein [Verrucomicrobia bacterium]|nr:MAG: methyltransferase domain-containing protein [Verrucomicrobiota bacterium]